MSRKSFKTFSSNWRFFSHYNHKNKACPAGSGAGWRTSQIFPMAIDAPASVPSLVTPLPLGGQVMSCLLLSPLPPSWQSYYLHIGVHVTDNIYISTHIYVSISHMLEALPPARTPLNRVLLDSFPTQIDKTWPMGQRGHHVSVRTH